MAQTTEKHTSEWALLRAEWALLRAEELNNVRIDPTGMVAIADGWRRLGESLAAKERQWATEQLPSDSAPDFGRRCEQSYDGKRCVLGVGHPGHHFDERGGVF